MKTHQHDHAHQEHDGHGSHGLRNVHSSTATGSIPVSPTAKYTCPMHPEIIRAAPVDCPICGMALVPIPGTGAADDSELRGLTRHFWLGTALTIPLVVLAMSPMVGVHEPFGLAPRTRGWVEFLLGTPVVLWAG